MECRSFEISIIIYFIYFSSVEIDINFLLVFPCLGAGHLSPSRGGGILLGIIIKIFVGFRGHLWIRDPYLGGQINKPFERRTKQ